MECEKVKKSVIKDSQYQHVCRKCSRQKEDEYKTAKEGEKAKERTQRLKARRKGRQQEKNEIEEEEDAIREDESSSSGKQEELGAKVGSPPSKKVDSCDGKRPKVKGMKLLFFIVCCSDIFHFSCEVIPHCSTSQQWQ